MKLRNGRISRTLERVATEPGLKRNVLTLVALIALASVSGGIILSHQRVNWPWHHDFVVYAAFQDVPGVSADHGQEVRIAGVRVGDIESASVDADGHAEVKLSLSPGYKIYSNATVVLRPKSPLNEMYIELSPGSPPAGKQLKSGGHLSITNSQRPIEVDEALDHLDANAQSALTTLLSESDVALANASHDLPAGVTATDLLTKQLAPIMTSLATRRATIQKLVTSLQEISTAVGGDDTRLTSLVTSLQKTLDAVGGGSNALDSTLGQLPDLSTQLKSATDAVQELSTQLNPALDNLKQASSALPPALKSLTATIDQAGVTVGQLSPVVADAAPVVRSLRPLVSDLAAALPDLQSMVNHLDPVTAELVKYLPDLGAFVLNSRSMTSEMDANSGILRGLLEVTPSSVPAGLLPSLSGK